MSIKNDKFNVNYASLYNKIYKNAHKLSDVKDQIEKVAFDIVRFKDDDSCKLWEIKAFDDGDYIVSLYNDNDALKKEASNPWEVSVHQKELNIFYKKEPITKIASSKLGFSDEDLNLIPKYLPQKLAENKSLRSSLLENLPEKVKNSLLARYPELSK